jgi:hypothetical protein
MIAANDGSASHRCGYVDKASALSTYPQRQQQKQPTDFTIWLKASTRLHDEGLFFYGMFECYLRGKRYDDPVPDAVVADEDTIAKAIIRSIKKDNLLKVPFMELSPNLAHAHLLIDALQKCFMMMRLQLDDEDDPQIIFETLNARGAPLQPSDLIRSFLFLRASRNGENVDDLYDNYWRQFDEKEDAKEAAKGTKFWKATSGAPEKLTA